MAQNQLSMGCLLNERCILVTLWHNQQRAINPRFLRLIPDARARSYSNYFLYVAKLQHIARKYILTVIEDPRRCVTGQLPRITLSGHFLETRRQYVSFLIGMMQCASAWFDYRLKNSLKIFRIELQTCLYRKRSEFRSVTQ